MTPKHGADSVLPGLSRFLNSTSFSMVTDPAFVGRSPLGFLERQDSHLHSDKACIPQATSGGSVVEGVASIDQADGDVSPASRVTFISSCAPSPMSAPSHIGSSSESSTISHPQDSNGIVVPEHQTSLSESNTVSHLQDSNGIIVPEHQTAPGVHTSYCSSNTSSQDIAKAISDSFLPTTNLPSTHFSKSPSPQRPRSASDSDDQDTRLSPSPDHDSDDGMELPSPPRIVARPPQRAKRSSSGPVSYPKRVKVSAKNGQHNRIVVKKVVVNSGENDEDDEDDEDAKDDQDDKDDEDDEDDMGIGTDEEDMVKPGDGGGGDNDMLHEEDTVSVPRLVVEGDKEVYFTMHGTGSVLTNLFLRRGKSHPSYMYIRLIKPNIMHIKGGTM